METTTDPNEPLLPPGRIRLELADYLALPNDGKRYEVLDGDLYVSPAPKLRHQSILGLLYVALVNALQFTGKGRVYQAPTDVHLAKHDVVQPDLLFVSTERSGILTEDRVEGAPDLVVEVLSPGNRARDRGIKSRRYAKAGVRVYWIVDPRHDLLEVYTLEGRSYRQVSVTRSPGVYESPDFPGVKIMLKEIFA